LNYTADYTPTTGGSSGNDYEVVAVVYDMSGRSYLSGVYNFTSYGDTDVVLTQNFSSANVSVVDSTHKGFVDVNYSVNNTGVVSAYDVVLSFAGDSEIAGEDYDFGNLSSGDFGSGVVRLNVSELTSPGYYNTTATLSWTDADGGSGSDSVEFMIGVEENKSIDYSPSSISNNVNSGSSNYSLLTVDNTGNVLLSDLNVVCQSGDLCSDLSVSVNESDFDIVAGGSRVLRILFEASLDTYAGSYSGVLSISGDGVEELFDVDVVVVENKSWVISVDEFSVSRGAGTFDDLGEVVISNIGNVNMTWDIFSSNESLVGVNVSSLTIPLNDVKSFLINYSAPVEEGAYYADVVVANDDASADPLGCNVSVNINSTDLDVAIISPTSSNVLSGVEAGDNLTILTNVSYDGENITSNSSWVASIGGEDCLNVSYEVDNLTDVWSISCVAPALSDGLSYDLVATITHDVYGEVESTEEGAVMYLDLTAPVFDFVRYNVGLGDN
jgi:hypothetical protein